MRKSILFYAFLIITLQFQSCTFSFFRGLAGPSYVKCFNSYGEGTDLKNALNTFYYKHPENIVRFETFVQRGYYKKDTILNQEQKEELEKEFFHWKSTTKGDRSERWKIMSSDGLYAFELAGLSCNDENLDCSLCIMNVLSLSQTKKWRNWKSYELTPKERRTIIRIFKSDIKPKLDKLVAENNLKSK